MSIKLTIVIHFFLFSLGTSQVEQHNGDDSRVCLRLGENEVYYAALHPREGYCKGWICWQSQLTLTSKTAINSIVNKFRNREASKVLTMNRLVWHWALEQEALRASETCTREHLEIFDERRNIDGLGKDLKCEYGCMKEEHTLLPSQIIFIQLLKDALSSNGLHDFNGQGKFRRGNAMYFGCALVVRKALSTTKALKDSYHFVCMYCTSAKTMSSVQKRVNDKPFCPTKTKYGGDSWYPNLCYMEKLTDIYVCPPPVLCPNDKAEMPLMWQAPDIGENVELIMLDTGNDSAPVILVNTTVVRGVDPSGLPVDVTNSRHFDNQGEYTEMMNKYPPVPRAVYFYEPYLLKYYKNEASLIIEEVKVKNPPLDGEMKCYLPESAVDGHEDAWCCGLLLLLSLIPTIMLIIAIHYTYKKNKIS